MYFYKDSNNLFHIDGDILPPGNYILRAYTFDTIISLESADTHNLTLNPIEVVLLQKEDDSYYISLSELLSEIDGFFQISVEGAAPPVTDVLFSIGQAASDIESDLEVGTNKAISFAPFNMTITEVFAGVDTSPVGSTLIVDINVSSLSILSTKIGIDAGDDTSLTSTVPPVISVTTLTKGAKISVDIDQIGAITPGKALTVYIRGILT